jgi:hypothetical protein
MSFSGVTARGNSTEQVAGDTTVVMNFSADVAAGKLLIACAVSDNLATSDGVSTDHSIADGASNTWTKIAEYTETDGVAADGVSVSTWYTVVTNAISAASHNLTLTTSAVTAEKILSCVEATFTDVGGIVIQSTGVGQAAIEASVSGLPSTEYLLIGHGGAEGTDNTKTPDADYTELYDPRTGSSGTRIAQHIQYRIATLTSDTVTSTGWTNSNAMTFLHAIREFTLPPSGSTSDFFQVI